ncbi:hypothetical protein SAMN06265348_11947 [Pedobacter westerhofensis]|uniref:Uncharacterized protein n=1 Tax=Pedobacter westerhofensis TaxID=425512 RepID=A0A521FSC4_9SPHI|nr:hypothetical protein SAMN06265348_11947 [Pedobacter westerhofensis]
MLKGDIGLYYDASSISDVMAYFSRIKAMSVLIFDSVTSSIVCWTTNFPINGAISSLTLESNTLAYNCVGLFSANVHKKKPGQVLY